jgi:hypothetical protein
LAGAPPLAQTQMSLEPVQRVLRSIDAPHALIGAHAMAARGYPRFTIDIDLLSSDTRVLASSLWTPLVEAGASVDARKGDADDPLAGVVHILLTDGTDIDVVVAKWKWEAAVIERAEPMHVAGTEIKVPLLSDLILLKLAAGGYADLQDAAALLALADEQTIPEVEQHIADVRPDVRPLWHGLLQSRQRERR